MKYVKWGGAAMAVAASLATVLLAGCAGLPYGAEPPAVSISDFGLGSAGFFEQQFNMTLRIQNPNPEEFKVDGIAFDLEINDQPFAKGVGNQAVTVPRYGSGFVPVEVVSTLGSLIRQFRHIAEGDKPAFTYRIRGNLSLAGGARIPFDQRGDFNFGLSGR